MTTLPQTISSRPRPVQSANGVPAVASPMMVPAPYQPAQQIGLTPADIWRVIRQNMWLFLLTIVLATAAGFGLNVYLEHHWQQWTAEGRVEVQLPRMYDPSGTVMINEIGKDKDLEVMLSNHAQMLSHPALLTQLLTDDQSATRNSPWLIYESTVRGQFDPATALEVLQDNFRARPMAGSSMIAVSMRAGDKDEARKILTEIVNRRVDQVRRASSRRTGDTAEFLTVLLRNKDVEIDRLATQLKNLRAGISADDGGDGTILNMSIMELTKLSYRAADELQLIQSELDSSRDTIARGGTLPSIEARIAQDQSLYPYRHAIRQLEAELEVGRATMGENNHQTKAMQRRLDVMRDQLVRAEDELRIRLTEEMIAQYQGAVARAESAIATYNKQLADLGSRQAHFAQQKAEVLAKEEELNQARLARADLLNRSDVVKLTTNNKPHEDLVWAAQPITPIEPSFPKLPLTMGATIVVGLGLAIGLAFLREVLDTSVRSPRDIARVGQINVLGIIPDDSHDPQAGDPLELTIANAPHSMTAEQFRLVRSRLGHVAPLDTTRSILVTSPQPGDGKTTVACNLAAGMALNGRRILLIDANFRRPVLHEVFEVPNERGFGECLSDPESFEELVKETSVPNLFVLPAGQRPQNPTELIEAPSFTEVVDRALEDYDHVIFDSGPILFVSETGALAPQCDGVVSVVRARHSSRGLLSRMRDTLRSLNVEHLGVVLNGMKHHAGGYYNRNIKTYYAYETNGKR